MSQLTESVKTYHSFHTALSNVLSTSPSRWKSDVNFTLKNDFLYGIEETMVNTETNSKEKERNKYYKRYELDDIPVKDDNSYNDHSFSEDNSSNTADNKDSLANSDLEKLELKILRKISQRLQTEDDSVSSLESNIKIFKCTVQQIFDKFYHNMQDFDLYKQRFNNIVENNKIDSIAEMENFIKDIIRHISSSNSNVSNNSKTTASSFRDLKTSTHDRINKEHVNNNDTLNNIAVHSYKNENYLTDSTLDGNSSNLAHSNEETLNIYLLSNNPRVEIKMKKSSLLSEINIRDQYDDTVKAKLASAENITKLAAKKLQLENYAKQEEQPLKDKYIPVKNSYAKKNIYLNEDFIEIDNKETNKFFLFKICSYLCKKLRKT